MKKSLLIFLFLPVIGFFQSKKERVVLLENRVDSLKTILSSERTSCLEEVQKLNLIINRSRDEISELNAKLKADEITITTLKTRNQALEDTINSLVKEKSLKKKESKWMSISLTESLIGIWMEDCDDFGPEGYEIRITNTHICIGMECGYEGSIQNVDYDIYNGQYRIQFINDNDMSGDGSPGEFNFY